MERIMIVDDDLELLEEMKEMLTFGKYDVEAVGDSGVAYEKACELQPNLIITDLKMRPKSGFQLAYEFQNSFKTKFIPMIALTGFFAEKEYASMLKMYNIKHTISKSSNAIDFLAKVKSVLDESKKNTVSSLPH
jgi:CheY-like chemotaxis protein